MPPLSLTRLFDRNPELRALFTGILAHMDSDACICDAAKNVLVGSTDGLHKAEHAISVSGEVIGWISDGRYASDISSLVEYMARREEEKKALGAELIERYRELNLLYHLSERLAASPHPESIFGVALDEALRLNKARAGFILTPAGEDAALQITAIRGFDYHSVNSGPLFQQVIQTGKADIANAVSGEIYLDEEKGQPLSLACAPIKTDQKVLGLIVLVRDQGGTFSAGSIKLLNSIAMQIAPLLEITRLYQIAVKNERIQQELLMARQVQESLLPTEMPQIAGWDFARLWRPAREVSGDFYDMINEGPGCLGLVIADITDKGMPASLFMAFTRTALRASIGHSETPAEAVCEANKLICQDSFESLFATLFYARLSTVSGEVTYVNAGHNPALLYRSRQDEILPLKRSGLPLGVEISSTYEQRTVDLQPGDFIFFYTDGITEAINTSNQEFGMDRLLRLVYELRKNSAGEILSNLEKAFLEFADPAQSFDDITMMAVKKLNNSIVVSFVALRATNDTTIEYYPLQFFVNKIK